MGNAVYIQGKRMQKYCGKLLQIWTRVYRRGSFWKVSLSQKGDCPPQNLGDQWPAGARWPWSNSKPCQEPIIQSLPVSAGLLQASVSKRKGTVMKHCGEKQSQSLWLFDKESGLSSATLIDFCFIMRMHYVCEINNTIRIRPPKKVQW